MQIKIDLKILIFVCIFIITNQLKIYILLMIFACIHELCHLIVGKILGFKVVSFDIKPIGYSVSFNNKVTDYNKKILRANILEIKKIIIYIVGPIINFLLAYFFYYANIYENLKIEIIYVNFIIGFVNLLPMYPLDGGRILKSIICVFCGIKKSYIYIEKISNIIMIILLFTTSLLILYLKNIGVLLIVICLAYLRVRESKIINNKINLYEKIDEMDVSNLINVSK